MTESALPAEKEVHGVVPLPGRREDWMDQVLDDHQLATDLIEQYGSPVNLINPDPVARHAAELVQAAAAHGVEARIFFARKANKALALVDAALAAGHGIDVASARELDQVLMAVQRAGGAPDRVILTAAVKPEALLRAALTARVTISVDNTDEFESLVQIAQQTGERAQVALRMQVALPDRPESRFGQPITRLSDLLQEPRWWTDADLVGLHFHLDGYHSTDRALALAEALDLIDQARRAGHAAEFIDIGGGVPMRYLDSPEPVQEFWTRHRSGDRMTWRDRELGAVYPVWQDRVRGDWLSDILTARVGTDKRTVAERIAGAGVRIHLEPGRSLLDGCGMTLARVEFRKETSEGTWLIGTAMNRTQMRSAADDFLVDPVLIPATTPDRARTPAGQGYLVGAYCIEAELLTWRRLCWPAGVAVGDVVAFVNTAGYLMHILESASHQIPLAATVVRTPDGWQRDEIDTSPASRASRHGRESG